MVYGVRIMLDRHPEWVVLHVDVQNAYNLISQVAIFKELRSSIGTLDQLFPFIRHFFACPSPLYFLEASRHGDLIVISSEFGTRQGDPLGGVLFALVHFCALRPTAITHPACVFPSLANDTHIVDPTLNVLPFFGIIGKIWCIKTFSASNKVCHLVSTKVKPIYITSSKFPYA
jgi:hypothetical protein